MGECFRITVGRFNTGEEIDFALAYLRHKIEDCRQALRHGTVNPRLIQIKRLFSDSG